MTMPRDAPDVHQIATSALNALTRHVKANGARFTTSDINIRPGCLMTIIATRAEPAHRDDESHRRRVTIEAQVSCGSMKRPITIKAVVAIDVLEWDVVTFGQTGSEIDASPLLGHQGQDRGSSDVA